MSNNEQADVDERDFQPIPKEWQDISLEELTEAGHEAVPPTSGDNKETEPMTKHYGRMTPPGRVPDDDSIDASSEDPRGTDQGYLFTGYDSEAATRIGNENAENSDQVERLRQLNEGRHRTDGNHSIREHRRDVNRLLETICSSLPLSSPEREKVDSVVHGLNFERFGYQKGIPRVILGTVAVVIDERHRAHGGDLDSLVSRSDEFRSIRDSLDLSMSDLSTIKETVREELNEGNVRIATGPKVPKRDPALPGPTPIDEQPDFYWENFSAERWAKTAQEWGRLPENLKEAVPDEYRDRIDLLQRWEPWEDEDDEDDRLVSADIDADETSPEKEWDKIAEEAEEMLQAMDEAADDERPE